MSGPKISRVNFQRVESDCRWWMKQGKGSDFIKMKDVYSMKDTINKDKRQSQTGSMEPTLQAGTWGVEPDENHRGGFTLGFVLLTG